MDHIVGIMWAKDEADIIEEIILDGLKHVDTMMIAEDSSSDRTPDIIESLAGQYPEIEYISVKKRPDKRDKAQRQVLLNEVRRRYKPESTLVHALESDIFILDTDIREAWKKYSSDDIGMGWLLLNGVRRPGEWGEVDEYPNWSRPIREVLSYAHYMELMLSTFRPLAKLQYQSQPWRPWPSGFTHYTNKHIKKRPKGEEAPLLFHVGYRGPTHFYQKYKRFGDHHPKYKTWKLSSPKAVEQTVAFFNGKWNGKAFPASREGWINRSKYK